MNPIIFNILKDKHILEIDGPSDLFLQSEMLYNIKSIYDNVKLDGANIFDENLSKMLINFCNHKIIHIQSMGLQIIILSKKL